MYCAKLTLIDRRHSASAGLLRSAKGKHATGTGFKRHCLIKELAQNASSAATGESSGRTSRNRYAAHDNQEEQQYLENTDGASYSWDAATTLAEDEESNVNPQTR